MIPGSPGGIQDVPEELMIEVRRLRAQGLGKDGIWRQLGDQLKSYITGSQLNNYIYSRTQRAGERLPSPEVVRENLGKIADLLERSGIDPEQIGKVEKVRVSTWQGITKDADGEAHVHELEGASVVLSPKWDDGPAWPLVTPGPPVRLPRPPKPKAETGALTHAVVVPDVQIGYRRDLDNGDLEPFHDEAAMAAALRVIRHVDPTLLVVLGDFLDFAEFSRFEQEPGFVLTTQPAIDRATLFLAELRAAAPSARFVFIEGNHDRRLQRSIVNNAISAFGLRPGFTPPDTWPDLSVPHLLRFDEIGVEYIGGYPAGLFWINERLAAIHGHKVNSVGSTAVRVVDDSRVSVIFGHVHRIELMHRTRRAYEGAKYSLAASPGCLCRVDGAVPSVKGSVDVFGRSVPTVEDWTQGLAVVSYVPGDGPFNVELVPIFDGSVIFRGRELT